ncbi:MAG: hypothetical protein B6D37_04800 [Sphingobacteriales bacterium UTBCD1]|jgi:hypothetical protein|nr:MAG: hypothetical protein B6D37_04800 [Sphingobacteriales bacterium UTBCD1]
MKRQVILFSLFLAVVTLRSSAQGDDLFTVNPGERIVQAIPNAAQYFSRNFISGLVWFKDDRMGRIDLNYNYLYGEMMFINEKGDTLAVASPQDFKLFALGKDTFYFAGNSYYHNLGAFGKLRLAEKTVFGITDVKKIGAMGVETSAVSIDQFRQVQQASTGMKDLVVQEKTIMKKVTEFYISAKEDVFVPATKKNIEKMLGGRESLVLKKYLDSNKVNFYKKEDLIALLTSIQ